MELCPHTKNCCNAITSLRRIVFIFCYLLLFAVSDSNAIVFGSKSEVSGVLALDGGSDI